VFGIAWDALKRHPEGRHGVQELEHEIACHGWRWIPLPMDVAQKADEREHLQRAIRDIPAASHGTAEKPQGWWYTGRDRPETPRRLLLDEGQLRLLTSEHIYGERTYAFWALAPPTARGELHASSGVPIPWTPTTCALRSRKGFNTRRFTFSAYLKDAFDAAL